jgi:15-cis-phytoene desaturase
MPKVAIFGGGVGGLTTAHELADRGFDVEIYDLKKKLWGGKARSMVERGSGTGGRKDLPGEHGFRFFPGFYKHVPDTMSRIPFPGNAKGVLDNLVPTTEFAMYREDGPPFVAPIHFPETIAQWEEALRAIFTARLGIGHQNEAFFVKQVLKLACSCQERMDYEYDLIAWWKYVEADMRGVPYQKFLAQGLTRSLVAMQAEISSTRTVGTMLLQLLYNMLTPGVEVDRVLNGPTNDQWIQPWVDYLKGKGVKFHLDSMVRSFNMDGAKIRSVTVTDSDDIGDAVLPVTADFYVSAIPAEKMASLLNADMLKAAPALQTITELMTMWMNGIQFYLSTDVPVVHGHTIYVDSAWAITSISQHQFWNGVDLSQYGDGRVKGILSIDISDWLTPGDQVILKPAQDCTAEEIKTECWAQLKAHLNEGGQNLLNDTELLGYHLDPDITFGHMEATLDKNKEPLLINKVGSLALRPGATTQIPNLFLASDYVNTYTNLATMEGANEAGRRAVNGILDAIGSKAERCKLWPYHSPWIFKAAQALDLIEWDLTHGKQERKAVVGG